MKLFFLLVTVIVAHSKPQGAYHVEDYHHTTAGIVKHDNTLATVQVGTSADIPSSIISKPPLIIMYLAAAIIIIVHHEFFVHRWRWLCGKGRTIHGRLSQLANICWFRLCLFCRVPCL